MKCHLFKVCFAIEQKEREKRLARPGFDWSYDGLWAVKLAFILYLANTEA